MPNIIHKFTILILTILGLFLARDSFAGVQPDMRFNRLGARDGLSNSQINCIFKDSKGFMWFGTQYGLNRYDGFRFKTFYKDAKDVTSIGNNTTDDIQEAYDKKLWIKQGISYCVYNPVTESFNRNPENLLKNVKIKGLINEVFIDKDKNFWIFVNGNGCYYYNPHNKDVHLFKCTKNRNGIPFGSVSTFGEYKKGVLITYTDGTIICLNGINKKVVWVNRDIPKLGGKKNLPYRIYVDSKYNIWVRTENYTYIYSNPHRRWYKTLNDLLRSYNFDVSASTILVKDVKEDYLGRMWIATDHRGLYILDSKKRKLYNYQNNKDREVSISDNTQQCLYQDNEKRMWIGTYKNGVNMYSAKTSYFKNLFLGDINTILEDRFGSLWIGTNDNGILKYNVVTGEKQFFNKATNGFASNTIVCSYIAKDGSLWFGTYEGGMLHYNNGVFSNYLVKNSGLVNNNVWAITGDRYGYIWAGMIDGGVQRFNPSNGEMKSFTTSNSFLSSNYVSSMNLDKNGNIIAGSSFYYSVINPKTLKITSFKVPDNSDIQPPSAYSVHTIKDSRGLVWLGTNSGMMVYDSKNKKLYLLDKNNGLAESVVCSVCEDLYHHIWIATEHGVSNITLEYDNGWKFHVQNYNYKDGLQQGPYNQRSIFRTRKGLILVGGQDGIDIINPAQISRNTVSEVPMFSGLILYDHEVKVGENYNGRIILNESLNENRNLVLKHSESVFTILLSSDNTEVHHHAQFMYKLEGFDDKWIKTNEMRPDVQFVSLAPGKYTLLVRVLDSEGNPGKNVSKLHIEILPPFYASKAAYAFYFVLFLLLIYIGRRRIINHQQEKFKIESIRKDAEKKHEIDEVKLKIFTNISHELRTPLTLIIAPIKMLIKSEKNAARRNLLVIICRNAMQLLTLVNQLLDFRKNDLHRMTLTLCTGDIVNVIRNITTSFSLYCTKKIQFSFRTEIESLIMSFDEDKISKIVKNLVNNAYKFSKETGMITITLNTTENSDRRYLNIIIADTGIGISDEDKKNIFERFYQSNDKDSQISGGSGVGLNLVQDFVEMHNGKITVEDNAGGGSVFTVSIPVLVDANAPLLENKDEELIESEIADDIKDDVVGAVGVTDTTVRTVTAEEDNKKRKEKKVLIVDDSEDFLFFISELLSEDYIVSVAHNGKEALARIAESRPDLVLSDVMMPVMDGNELCRSIKDNPDMKNIPVIMLTARLSPEHEKESLTVGADDYITKPFDIDLLNIRISKVIERSKNSAKNTKHVPEIKSLEITSMDEIFMKESTEYVEKHLSEDISVESMSEALGMSRIHLYKKMVAITGATPSEFIRNIRLRYAEQMLAKSQKNISEIAYSVGFNSPRIFSKYFKEMYGVTPSQYEKKS